MSVMPSDPASPAAAAETLWQRCFEGLVLLAAAVAVLLVLVFPLIAVDIYYTLHTARTGQPHAAEATVGIAVVLRATARRVLRTSASNVLRTTAGAVSRASARTITRRFFRVAEKYVLGMLVRDLLHREDAAVTAVPPAPWRNAGATLAGFAALVASFWGVLYLAPADVVQLATFQGAVPAWGVAVLAAIPLLFHVLAAAAGGSLCRAPVRVVTAVDGLLLQAYFTGSGSYLPMTTDVRVEGSANQQAGIAVGVLLSQWCLHAALAWTAAWTGNPYVEILGSACLVYAFVCSFPIAPLDGHAIWQRSKLGWLLVELPILASFLRGGTRVLEGVL